MKNTNLSIWAMAGTLVLIGATFGVAEDWHQWRGVDRAGKIAGFTAPQDWPEELTQQWKVTVGTGDATPALVGDRLYVFARQGGDEVTLCLDAASGDEIWRDAYAALAVTGPAVRHSGPRSSPAVAEGKIVTLGVGGILSCLDAATGEVVWRKDEFPNAVPVFYTAMSPIIVDGMAIAHLGGADKGAIMALDLVTGEEKWKWDGDGPSYASPVLMTVQGTKQIVVPGEKGIVSLAVADGKLLWQIPSSSAGGRMSYSASTPIVDGQTVIYSGAGQGTKAAKIEKQGDDFAVIELWNNEELSSGFATPILKDGLLFGLSDRGNFFCINAETGESVWTDTNRSGRFGAILDAGSVILALPDSSELIAYEFSDKGYSELARIKVADTPTYTHPVIAGNRVYVKDDETVTMWTIE
ncbi:PQQ-like beta-propeller repeat protein [Candidatus Sumerlaeota bacterium]|nr:PQQ-like beta-propeller repeat protein [Candidatus Sumerlaeota bacterium]